MDVRSCWKAGTTSREALMRNSASRSLQRTLSRARQQALCFLLTVDLHGRRQWRSLKFLRPRLPIITGFLCTMGIGDL